MGFINIPALAKVLIFMTAIALAALTLAVGAIAVLRVALFVFGF